MIINIQYIYDDYIINNDYMINIIYNDKRLHIINSGKISTSFFKCF